ncbi:MAG: hypothetical protein HXX20_13945 [Chloroflexi bacterium]|nr:hypothetical protein [Chloroflexota bacterium]
MRSNPKAKNLLADSAQSRPVVSVVPKQGLWHMPRRIWDNSVGYYALAALFFLSLAVVYTWPVVLAFDRIIPGFATDQDQNIWSLWWVKYALLDLHTNPFHTNYLFYPYGTNLYLHALAPLLGVLVIPWNLFAGPIAAYNAAALFGLATTGVTATALGRTVSGNRWGGLVAGYIITFSPIHFSYVSLGQIEFLNLWPFLLYLLFLIKLTDRSVEKTGPSPTKNAKYGTAWLIVGAAVSLVLAGFVTFYYVAFSLLFTLFYLLLRGLPERRWYWWRTILVRFALVWLLFALSFGYFGWRVWQSAHSGEVKVEARPIVIINESVTLHGYFTEFDANILLGKLLGLAHLAPLNRVHYIGFGVLVLAGLGLLWGRRLGLRHTWVWLALALFFAIAAFGPTVRTDPHVNPEIGPTEAWLPWNWLQAIPLVNITHSPTRLALIALICVAMLVSQGVAYLSGLALKLRQHSGRFLWQLIPVTLVLVLVLEGPALPALTRSMPLPPQVSVIKADCASIGCGDALTLDLPFTQATYTRDSDLMLYGALRQRPVMGGYLSREIVNPYLSEKSPFHLFLNFKELNQDIFQLVPYQSSVVALLNDYKIRYLTVDQGEFERTYDLTPAEVTAYLTNLLGPEARIYTEEGLEIYRVPSPNLTAPTPLMIPTIGWQAIEKETIPKRWMGDKASLVMYSFQETTTRLNFEAAAFHRLRHLAVTLNGQLVGTLEIQPDQMLEYRLDNLKLHKGENLVVFDPLEEPESPSEVLPGSKDTRRLTVTLRQVSLGQ